MSATVALLRGVNVGGKHKLPMAELVALLQGLGCGDVRTYIQSGNALFAQPKNTVTTEQISEAIAARFGFDVPVVLRTQAELRAVLDACPFPVEGLDPKLLHVGFLTAEPAAERISALDPARWGPDELRVVGANAYLWYPSGSGRSKLTAPVVDRALGVTMTARNWRTVGELFARC